MDYVSELESNFFEVNELNWKIVLSLHYGYSCNAKFKTRAVCVCVCLCEYKGKPHKYFQNILHPDCQASASNILPFFKEDFNLAGNIIM